MANNGPVLTRTFELGQGAGVGFLVIDSDLGGGGTGGIRMGEDVTVEEVAALASEMSHKFAWLNIARGGAKSGINCASDVSKTVRESMLAEFGTAIKDVLTSRRYVAGMDLGVGPDELGHVMTAAGMDKADNPVGESMDSSYFTALTVYIAIVELLRQSGATVKGTTMAVEGLGKVGRHLLQLIDNDGGIINGVSTIDGAVLRAEGIDVKKILALAASRGDACIRFYDDGPVEPAAALYSVRSDVLVPGARVHGIHEGNVDKLQVSFVVPMANAAATSQAEETMHSKGIRYLPGFVTNSGGIFCWYLARLDEEARDTILKKGFGQKVANLIREADERNVSIASLARRQVAIKVKRMAAEESGGFVQTLIGMLRKFSPMRLPYVSLSKILGRTWASRDSMPARWYFNARYFN